MAKKKLAIMLIASFLLLSACGPSLTQTREDYLKANPNISEAKKEAILKGEAVVGMTEKDVQASCGSPNIVSRGVGKNKEICDYWGYKRYKVYFDQEGKVIEVK